MSYNVAICRPPIPANNIAAWKYVNALCAQHEGKVPAVYQELITLLTARYPCICDLPDEDVDDGVWSDGPLRNNAGHGATVLGMVYSRVEEALPFLVTTANSLGLTVFDWQTERIHRA